MFLCAVTRVSGAVLQVLLPIMNDIKDDLSSVKRDLTSLNETVGNLTGTVGNLTGTVGDLSGTVGNLSGTVGDLSGTVGNLSGTVGDLTGTVGNLTGTVGDLSGTVGDLSGTVGDLTGTVGNLTGTVGDLSGTVGDLTGTVGDLSGTVGDLSGDVEEHKSQVTSKLADLQNILKEKLHTHDMKQDSIDVKIDALDSKQDELDLKLVSVNSELQQTVLSNLTEQLQKTYGYLQESLPHTCGGTGGWRRVVYLNMTDPNTNCPSGWQLTGHSKRTCGRVSTGRLTCDSVTFPVSGGDYTRVCGRIKAYQYEWIDAFQAYDDGLRTTIDGSYVSGVSLTHGSPRQHIWTFAAGVSETYFSNNDACPCDATIDITTPPFVGGDYFCESGRPSRSVNGFYPDDPLWDGEGCSASSTCCSFNSPPYFTKQLPSPTTDYIEARLCLLDSGEDSPIEFIELYVQ